MQTFTFIPQNDAKRTAAPKVLTVQFGDGYEQRKPQGIHHNLRTFDLIFKGTETQIGQITDFLNEHGGYRAFYWTPYQDKPGKFKCAKWETTLNTGFFTLTATFEEVVA